MKTKDMTLTGIMVALLTVCSQLIIPLGPVPITLQTFAVLTIGYFLHPKNTLLATSLYLIMGLTGLPVFSGFSGGFQAILMPSFGFIVGFIPASYLQAQYLQKYSAFKVKHLVLAGLLNFLVTYLFGLTYMTFIFKFYMAQSLTLNGILLAGLLPFIPGDLLKLIGGVLLAKQMLPILHRKLSMN